MILKTLGILRSRQPAWNKGLLLPHLSAKNSNHWKGGKAKEGRGYVYFYVPEHPNAIHGRYILEHRLVIEKSLGRYLDKKEIIHHKNGIKTDNRLCNLELMSPSEHVIHHLPRYGTGEKIWPKRKRHRS